MMATISYIACIYIFYIKQAQARENGVRVRVYNQWSFKCLLFGISFEAQMVVSSTIGSVVMKSIEETTKGYF